MSHSPESQSSQVTPITFAELSLQILERNIQAKNEHMSNPGPKAYGVDHRFGVYRVRGGQPVPLLVASYHPDLLVDGASIHLQGFGVLRPTIYSISEASWERFTPRAKKTYQVPDDLPMYNVPFQEFLQPDAEDVHQLNAADVLVPSSIAQARRRGSFVFDPNLQHRIGEYAAHLDEVLRIDGLREITLEIILGLGLQQEEDKNLLIESISTEIEGLPKEDRAWLTQYFRARLIKF
jgi:hypothetical protein